MKKPLSILFAVLAALTIFTSTVFAAAGNKSVTLLSVSYQKGGIVLLFEASGLTKGDLKNTSFFADSNDHKMSCNFVDNTTTVRCTVSKALAGEGEFHGTLAGFGFWGELPQERTFGITCGAGEVPWISLNGYYNGELFGSGSIPVWFWDWYAAQGYLEEDASYGVTYEITGSFCAPDWEEFPL